jgi:hypothetical protein
VALLVKTFDFTDFCRRLFDYIKSDIIVFIGNLLSLGAIVINHLPLDVVRRYPISSSLN